jgi:hypothetical protein
MKCHSCFDNYSQSFESPVSIFGKQFNLIELFLAFLPSLIGHVFSNLRIGVCQMIPIDIIFSRFPADRSGWVIRWRTVESEIFETNDQNFNLIWSISHNPCYTLTRLPGPTLLWFAARLHINLPPSFAGLFSRLESSDTALVTTVARKLWERWKRDDPAAEACQWIQEGWTRVWFPTIE